MLLTWAFKNNLLITDQDEGAVSKITAGHIACFFAHFQDTGCATASIDHSTIHQFRKRVVEDIMCINRFQILCNVGAIIHERP